MPFDATITLFIPPRAQTCCLVAWLTFGAFFCNIQGIRNTVNDYLLSFGGYDWLWKDDKDEAYDDFMSKNPSLDDYEAQLKTFSATEEEIGEETLEIVH